MMIRMWKETVVAYFKVLFQHPGKIKKETWVRITGSRAEMRTGYLIITPTYSVTYVMYLSI
jgi:hypothetical protein